MNKNFRAFPIKVVNMICGTLENCDSCLVMFSSPSVVDTFNKPVSSGHNVPGTGVGASDTS